METNEARAAMQQIAVALGGELEEEKGISFGTRYMRFTVKYNGHWVVHYKVEANSSLARVVTDRRYCMTLKTPQKIIDKVLAYRTECEREEQAQKKMRDVVRDAQERASKVLDGKNAIIWGFDGFSMNCVVTDPCKYPHNASWEISIAPDEALTPISIAIISPRAIYLNVIQWVPDRIVINSPELTLLEAVEWAESVSAEKGE